MSVLHSGRSNFPTPQTEPTFSARDDGAVVVGVPAAGGGAWPGAGVPAAVTMTPLAQGAATHDTHAPPPPPPPPPAEY